MSLFCRLLRKHYWGAPHRESNNKLVQVCYECGAERPASELYNEVSLWHSFDSRRGAIDGAARGQRAEEPVVVVVSPDFKGNLSLVK
jgi:hypothetical protein